MARLVDDLLDVSRIGCGKIQLQKRRLDLHEAVEHAIERVQPLAVARRQRLEVSVPKGPLWLEADPTRLEQVLVNLLTNACKYTPESGRVWLSAESGGDEVCVRVRDNGAGLDAALLPRVFDLFVQAQDGSQGGLGIGLNLVRGLVRLHGGTVTAHSEGPGKGSEFVVRLPASTGLPPGDEGNGGPIALPDSGCSPESVPAAHTKDSAVPAAIASGDGA